MLICRPYQPQVLTMALATGLFVTIGQAQPQQQGRRPPQPPPGVEVIRDVEFGTGGGRPLHLHIARPETPPAKPMPVVVYIHGGGWRNGNHRGPQNLPFAARGYFTVNVEYRLSGEAIFPAQIEDCKAAIRWVRANAEAYNVNPDRIGVWGHSAGGHLAALLGTSAGVEELEGEGGSPDQTSAVQAVVDCFGPTDFLRMNDFPGRLDHDSPASPESMVIGGPIQENPEQVAVADPITYVDADDPPFLILHGENDELVPISQSEILHEALTAAGVESTSVRVKNAGHGFSGNPDPDRREIQEMIREFFDRHLRDQ